MMRRMRLVCTVAGLMACGVAMGQAPAAAQPSGPAAEVQRSYAALKVNILKAADGMPGADYKFKPTPEIRTFARGVTHTTDAQLRKLHAAHATAPGASRQ